MGGLLVFQKKGLAGSLPEEASLVFLFNLETSFINCLKDLDNLSKSKESLSLSLYLLVGA